MMQLFNRQIQVSLNILQLLYKKGQMGATQLARELGESDLWVYKILTTLKGAGYIKADRGPGGGYRLQSGILDTTLMRLINTMGKRVDPSMTLTSTAASEVVTMNVATYFETTTLAKVFKIEQPEPPISA